MLSSDQKRKLQRGYQWKNAQEKANFYKNKRAQLKDWLDKLPDMLLIFEMAVHQKQIKNMKLEDKLADLIKFTDAFLDAINPLPVAENPHVNRNVVFQNALIDVTKSLVELQQEGFDERLIVPMDGRKILLYSRFWAATKKEIQRCDVLKKHAERLQRYIDPSIFVYFPNVPDNERERNGLFEPLPISPDNRHEFVEHF